MSLGTNIKRIRQENDLSQAQFANIFHVTRQTVSNWENDKNYPDLSVLKEMSHIFDVSFDLLLKDDDNYIRKTVRAIKLMSLFKRVLLVLVIIILMLFGGFCWLLHLAATPTPDGERINSDTDIRMVINTSHASPSRAITCTTELSPEDSKYQDTINKYKGAVLGSVEGDIPAVYLDGSPTLIFHFQDLLYNDIKPENVLDVSAEIYDIYSDNEKPFTKKLDHELDDGNVKVVIDPELSQDQNDEDDIWWRCIITIKYSYKGKIYTGVTAVEVFGKEF